MVATASLRLTTKFSETSQNDGKLIVMKYAVLNLLDEQHYLGG